MQSIHLNDYNNRPLKLGFTVIREGLIYQYEPIGINIYKPKLWPQLNTLKDI